MTPPQPAPYISLLYKNYVYICMYIYIYTIFLRIYDYMYYTYIYIYIILLRIRLLKRYIVVYLLLTPLFIGNICYFIVTCLQYRYCYIVIRIIVLKLFSRTSLEPARIQVICRESAEVRESTRAVFFGTKLFPNAIFDSCVSWISP